MSLILMYHRIAVLERDPFNLAVHPDRFAQQVDHLAATGRVVPLEEVLQPGPRGRVALTFDDAYADNATVAAPLVSDAGLPATWFVPTGRLGRQQFWWDRLAGTLLGPHPLPPSLDVELAGRQLWFDLRTPQARATALYFLRGRLMGRPAVDLEAAVDRIVGLLGAGTPTRDGVTMTVEQLRRLATLPLQQVGAHTRSHAQLRSQPEQVQRDEIIGSVQQLSGLLGRPVVDFAYPFGHIREDVGSLAPRLVQEAGCRLACTTAPGLVRRRGNPYLLPRLFVENWSAEEFSAHLRAALLRP